MKILLINPPQPQGWYNNEFYPPLSLLYLGAVLKANGDCVEILDLKTLRPTDADNPACFYEAAVVKSVERLKPDLIGFGCLFSGNFNDVLRLSNACKQTAPETRIATGGIHFTIYAQKILETCPSIDWIILGEGEDSVVQLVNMLKHGCRDLGSIDGFAFRDDGRPVVHAKTRFIQDIDQIPFPAYDLIRISDYYVDTSAWHNPKGLSINTSLPVITSRSCPHRCTFCSMYRVMGERWRARSARNVVDEIELLYHRYNHRHFSFMDDNLTLSKKRTLEICRLIKERNLDLQFETPNGLSLRSLDEETIDRLVEAGMVRTYLAIESGSDYIRNQIMKKKVSQKQIENVVRWTRKHPQLFVNAFFIIGMPEETAETLEETYAMIRDIDVDKVHIHNIVPFPSTSVYEQALRDGLLVNLDAENLHKAGKLYFKNRETFFIKPYRLSLGELSTFREKVDDLLNASKSSRSKESGRRDSICQAAAA
jgi:magnesium-protoporphyrin IX monomethyl ester (oxidative) cyclase